MQKITALMIILIIAGCNGVNSDPNSPGLQPQNTLPSPRCISNSPLLWGIWDISITPNSSELVISPLRTANLTWNVTMYLQPPAGNIANLGIQILDSSKFLTEGYIDIRVSLTHPFASPKLRGFDVRGLVMGNGSITDSYNADIKYPSPNDLRLLNADGYTRWMNWQEFQTQGILGYTPGKLGSPGFYPSATLSGYKYFAEMINTTQSVYEYFAWSPPYVTNRGSMAPASSLSRDYHLKFPSSPLNAKFQYAVIANWEKATSGGSKPTPLDFPQAANALEPISLSVVDSSSLYFESISKRGGNIKLKLFIVDWWAHFDKGNLSKHLSKIIVSSSTIQFPAGKHEIFYYADLDHMPTSAGNAEAVEISINNCLPSGVENQEILIALEMTGHDYSNQFGILNSAWNDPLTGYYLHKFTVSPEFNDPPIIISGVTGPKDAFITETKTYYVEASDPESQPLTYAWTIKDPLTGFLIYGPVPGTTPGTWDASFPTIAKPGSIEIWCEVSDGEKSASAKPLAVHVEDTLFHADMNDTVTGGNAGWTTTGSVGTSKWTQSAGEDNVLQGYGRKFAPFFAQYIKNSADILVSPPIAIPPEVERAIAIISHSYDFEYYLPYEIGFDGGNIKITEVPTLPKYSDPEVPILAGKDYDGWLYDTEIDGQLAFSSDQFKNELLVSALEIPKKYIGSSLYLSFAAATDSEDFYQNHGWLIDDVKIRALAKNGNAPPIPGSSVTGDDKAVLTSNIPSKYSCIGYDLENDPLSYVWTIEAISGGDIVWGPHEGGGSGTLEIYWGDIVSQTGKYRVHCSIYDGHNAGVQAEPLTVTVQAMIFHADFSDTVTGDNSGWTAILESGETKWTTSVGSDPFLAGYGYKWGDFGKAYKENSQGILLSPPISIPSGISSASIYILHDFQFLPSLDGGNIKITSVPVKPTFTTKETNIDDGYGYDVKLAGTVMDKQWAFGIGAGGGKLMKSRIDLPSSYFGHKIYIGFAVASGTTFFNMRGWLIDDVSVVTSP